MAGHTLQWNKMMDRVEQMSPWQYRTFRHVARNRTTRADNSRSVADQQVKSLAQPAGQADTSRKRTSSRATQATAKDVASTNKAHVNKLAWRPVKHKTKAMQTESHGVTFKDAVLQTDEPEVSEATDSDTGGGGLVRFPVRDTCSRSMQQWVDELDLVHFQTATADAVEADTQTTQTQTVTTQVGQEGLSPFLQYGDVARVRRTISAYGYEHSFVNDELIVIPRRKHDLLQIPVGECGLIKQIFDEKGIVKIRFPDVGTIFVSLVEAETCFDLLLPRARLHELSSDCQ